MTEAHIPAKNVSDVCDETVEKAIENNTAAVSNNDSSNITTAINQDSFDNDSLLYNQQKMSDVKANDVNNTVDTKNIEECAEHIEISANDCIENLTPINEISDNDTVLKYVYKKNEEESIPLKSKGHVKNSLKRKKRSTDEQNTDELNSDTRNVPVIVDYETSHLPKDREAYLDKRSANILKGADFNIETLHERKPRRHNVENPEKYYYKEKRPHSRQVLRDDSRERSRERGAYNDDRRHDSEERSEKDSGRKSERIRDNNENNENTYTRNNKATYSKPHYDARESSESEENDNSSYKKNSRESQEGEESDERSNKSTYTKTKDESGESSEKEGLNKPYRKENSGESKESDYYKDIRKANLGHSTESSEESNEKETLSSKQNAPNSKEDLHDRSNSTSAPIQDVDLGDFSYERIQVNNKGQVEPAKDSHENYNADSSLEVAPLSTSKPSTDSKQNLELQSLSIEAAVSPSSQKLSEENKQPININDGEIKPVVELNSESNESSEENNDQKELQKAILDTDDKDVETLHSRKDLENNEQKDKLIEQKNEKGDVKQQFERIPLNYNHDNKKQGVDNKDDVNTKTVESSSGLISEEKQSDGTVDTLSPKDERYDENLNFKFDDIRIELPEIKLPEDILSYNYDAPLYENKDKDKEKDRFYHYSDEVSKENVREQKNRDDDNEEDNNSRGYYGYGYDKDEKKQNYKKKQSRDDDNEEEDEERNEDNEDQEDVDLYEKFVRERFGKRGSFEKRSEKLRDDARHVPENPQLYETIHKVLKKAEETEKEAAKSGDPNAAYMWTLEYGENL